MTDAGRPSSQLKPVQEEMISRYFQMIWQVFQVSGPRSNCSFSFHSLPCSLANPLSSLFSEVFCNQILNLSVQEIVEIFLVVKISSVADPVFPAGGLSLTRGDASML